MLSGAGFTVSYREEASSGQGHSSQLCKFVYKLHPTILLGQSNSDLQPYPASEVWPPPPSDFTTYLIRGYGRFGTGRPASGRDN